MSFRRQFKRHAFQLRKQFGPPPQSRQMTGLIGSTPGLRIREDGAHVRKSDIPAYELQGLSVGKETRDLSRMIPGGRRYQGPTGSCVGFASAIAAGILGSQYREGMTPVSAFWNYYWARAEWGLEMQDNGSYTDDGIRMMAEHGAVSVAWMDDESSPYDQPPDVPEEHRWRINGHRQIVRWTERDRAVCAEAIWECLNQGLPVIIGIALPNVESDYVRRTGRLDMPRRVSDHHPEHCVCIVKGETDSTPRNGRFIFDNSWGAQWGMAGFGSFPAGFLEYGELACDPQTFTTLHGATV